MEFPGSVAEPDPAPRPLGFKLVAKGKRKGVELAWTAVVSGEAALATALNASIGARGTLEGSHRHSSHTKH